MNDINNGARQQLHWTQRIALVRHNLHSARRTNDFTFFKSLQAHALLGGTDHVALLQSSLGDQADTVLSTLDNLNAGIAYVHQGTCLVLHLVYNIWHHLYTALRERLLENVTDGQNQMPSRLSITPQKLRCIRMTKRIDVPCFEWISASNATWQI